MESLDDVPIWNNMILLKKSMTPLLQAFELESTENEYPNSSEENMLHDYRSRINIYEHSITNGKNWEYYKKIVNPFELVYTQKKYEEFPESICFLRPLSRSYFKMIEMLDLIQFFESIVTPSIRTAHVCEGPGGFIEALFDAASKHNKKIQLSIAMTLKSKQSNIPGWKRASFFLQKNKNVRIIFGEDQTGDIMKAINQQHFIDHVVYPEYGGKMDIYTADGGFDFSYDYKKQEQMIFPLLVASTKIGFEVLKKGGVFILKLFDFYRKTTVDLIYFLSCHFQEWTLYKPGMSRPCNPEHYFIGKGFTGCTEEVLDIMRLWCNILENNQPLESLYKTEYSVEFTEIINTLRENSFKSQTEYLKRVFYIIEQNNSDLIQSYLKKNEKSSYDWCVRFNVPIYAHRRHSIEVLHTDPPASSPQ